MIMLYTTMIFFRTLQCNHKRTYYITSQYKLRRQSESEIRSFSRAFTYKDHRKRPSSKKSNIMDVEKGLLYEICSRDTPIQTYVKILFSKKLSNLFETLEYYFYQIPS